MAIKSKPTRPIRRGWIKLGTKTGEGRQTRVKDSPFFLLPAEVAAVHPGDVTALPIMFHSSDPEQIAYEEYQLRTQVDGREVIICRGDGDTATRVDMETGNIDSSYPCPDYDCEDRHTKHCKRMMRLQFMIQDVPGIGIWEVKTHSVNSCRAIGAALEALRGLYAGDYSYQPLTLTLTPTLVNTRDAKGNRMKTTKFILGITTDRTPAQIRAAPHQRATSDSPAGDQRAGPAEQPAPTSGIIDDDDDEETQPEPTETLADARARLQARNSTARDYDDPPPKEETRRNVLQEILSHGTCAADSDPDIITAGLAGPGSDAEPATEPPAQPRINNGHGHTYPDRLAPQARNGNGVDAILENLRAILREIGFTRPDVQIAKLVQNRYAGHEWHELPTAAKAALYNDAKAALAEKRAKAAKTQPAPTGATQ